MIDDIEIMITNAGKSCEENLKGIEETKKHIMDAEIKIGKISQSFDSNFNDLMRGIKDMTGYDNYSGYSSKEKQLTALQLENEKKWNKVLDEMYIYYSLKNKEMKRQIENNTLEVGGYGKNCS